jgi:hypothetical protein
VNFASAEVHHYDFEFPPEKGTVREVEQYLSIDHEIRVLLPDCNQISKTLVARLKSDSPNKYVASAEFRKVNNNAARFLVYTSLPQSPNITKITGIECDAKYVTIEGHGLREWLGPKILDSGKILPVLDDIGDISIIEAPRILRNRIENLRPKVSFFGISVEGQLVMIAGPTLFLLLNLYLISHLIHIQKISDDNMEVIRSFPWAPLFSGTLGATLAYSSTLVLPVFACSTLVFTVLSRATMSLFWIPILLTLGVTISGLYASRWIWILRNLCDMANAANSADAKSRAAD